MDRRVVATLIYLVDQIARGLASKFDVATALSLFDWFP